MRNQTRQLIGRIGPVAVYLSAAAGLILFALALTRLSQSFGYDWAVIDMPVLTLAALLITAGAFYFVFCALHTRLNDAAAAPYNALVILVLVLAGLIARLILIQSEPALEDDYQRYLWDGAVTANGFNPYLHAPSDVVTGGSAHPLADIADQSGPVLQRINHKNLKTIYPPVAQAAFALAYAIKPFSLVSWRSLIVVSELATLGLLFLLLAKLGRSPLWAMIYWINPMVLKEFINSAHMDALLAPFVLSALYFTMQKRSLLATGTLTFAIGLKLWPVLLIPLVWRNAIGTRRELIANVLLLAMLGGLILSPYILTALGDQSGAVAYARNWTINAPLYTTLRDAVTFALTASGQFENPQQWGAMIARVLLAAVVVLIALVMARKPAPGGDEVCKRALIIIAALIFCAPAIYPWYTLWMAPLLALVPELALLLLTVTIPLYYSYFYFAARSMADVYRNAIVWLVWLPVWLSCIASWNLRHRHSSNKRSEQRA